MRKWAAATIAMAILLGACGSDGGGKDGGSLGTPISLLVSGEPEETAVYEGLVDAFMQENPGTTVELIEIADADDALARLSTGFAGGDPPDVFLINFREYSQFAARGALEPIGEHLGEAGIDTAAFYEQPIEAFTYDGVLQCTPQNVSSLAVYYNTRLFREAGLKRPADDWSWADLRKAALTLTKGDVYGLGIDAKFIRMAPFVWGNGGEIVDDPVAPTRFTLDTPEAREALQFAADLVRQDRVIPGEEEQAAEDLESRFAAGRLGMFFGSRRDTAQFREVRDLDWDVLRLPVAQTPATILHSDALCISKGSSNLETALDLVAFAMGEEGQTLIAFTGRTVPSLRSVSTSTAYLDPSQPPRHAQIWLDAIPTIRRTPVIATWAEIEGIADEVITRMFFEEGYTVDDAVAELTEQTERLFEEGTAAQK